MSTKDDGALRVKAREVLPNEHLRVVCQMIYDYEQLDSREWEERYGPDAGHSYLWLDIKELFKKRRWSLPEIDEHSE